MNKKHLTFFDLIHPISYISHEHYKNVPFFGKAFQAFAKFSHKSFYLADFYKKSFQFVSLYQYFLCGYSEEEILKMGFDFYLLNVPPADLELLFHLNEALFIFFYELPINRRKHVKLTFDLKLKPKDKEDSLLINHQIIPFLLTDDGNLWMSICQMTLSARSKSNDYYIIMQDDNTRYDFNHETKAFEFVKHAQLTHKEEDILKYMCAGYTTKSIAIEFNISESTVKNHKTKILKKLNMPSSSAAIYYTTNHNLI